MKIPQIDLRREYLEIREEINIAIQEVLESQQFILGEFVQRFESWFANYVGTKYAIGVASGSDALLVSLMALDVGTYDAVITTPFTFFATAGSIARLRATPIFIDIDHDSYNISPEKLEWFLAHRANSKKDGLYYNDKKIKAIIPVHLYGQPALMDEIMEIANKYQLYVIEDCAQSIGASLLNQKTGTFGHFGCFSFFPTKNLGGYGDGGMITTNDEKLYEKVKALRVHGSTSKKYYHELVGLNSRLDALQANILYAKSKYIEEWNEKREKIASRYISLFQQNEKLAECIQTPKKHPKVTKHVWHQFTIRAKNRDELQRHLNAKQIGTTVYYPLSLHLQPCFRYLGYREGDLPVSEQAQREVLSLPMFPGLRDEEVEQVVNTIIEFFTTQFAL